MNGKEEEEAGEEEEEKKEEFIIIIYYKILDIVICNLEQEISKVKRKNKTHAQR
jgi:hypothetical protein